MHQVLELGTGLQNLYYNLNAVTTLSMNIIGVSLSNTSLTGSFRLIDFILDSF